MKQCTPFILVLLLVIFAVACEEKQAIVNNYITVIDSTTLERIVVEAPPQDTTVSVSSPIFTCVVRYPKSLPVIKFICYGEVLSKYDGGGSYSVLYSDTGRVSFPVNFPVYGGLYTMRYFVVAYLNNGDSVMSLINKASQSS